MFRLTLYTAAKLCLKAVVVNLKISMSNRTWGTGMTEVLSFLIFSFKNFNDNGNLIVITALNISCCSQTIYADSEEIFQ